METTWGTVNFGETMTIIVQKLADFTGMAVEVISENLPTYLAKYGWYVTLTNGVPNAIGAALLIAFTFIVIIGFIGLMNYIINDKIWSIKAIMTPIIIVIIIALIISIGIAILPCIVAPEIVGLEHLISLIGGN